jgi:hypothetical protein
MNMKFTPATLVLALSATPVALAKVDANGAGGLASNRFSGGDGEMMKATPSRASERMLMLPLDAPDGTGGAGIAGSSEIDVADTGILRLRRLSRTSIHVNDSGRMRSLQEDEATCVKPDTCEPSLCSCVANGGDGYDCATELNAVCNNVTAADGTVFTIKGCVDVYADFYYNIYCSYAECVVDGGSKEECKCKLYNIWCALYDTEEYTVSPCVVSYGWERRKIFFAQDG